MIPRLLDFLQAVKPFAKTPTPVTTAGSGNSAPLSAEMFSIVNHCVPLFHPAVPVIFLWTHKSGCTNVIKWFLYQADLIFDALDHTGIHNYLGQVYKTPDYLPRVAQAIDRGDRPLLKFTRNPYSRAVSSFLVLSRSYKAPFVNAEWNKIRAFRHGDEASERGISFSDFLDFLQQTGAGAGQANSHFAQQYNPAEAAFDIATHDIADMSAVFENLQRRHGLHPYLDPMLESPHHNKYSGEQRDNYADLEIGPATFVADQPPVYTAFYNDKTKAQVAEIFRDDFENYRYAPDRLAGNYIGEPVVRDSLSPDRAVPKARSLRYQVFLSKTLLGQGARPEALAVAAQAVALDPGDVHARNHQALALVANGELEAAQEIVRAAIAQKHSVAGLHLTLSTILARQGQLDAAIEAQDAALALKPENAFFLRRREALQRQRDKAGQPKAKAG